MLPSLRARLVAVVVGAQLLLALGLVWAGIAFTHRQLRQAFDASLQSHARSLAARVHYSETGSGLVFDPTPTGPTTGHPALYCLVKSDGAVIAGNFSSAQKLPAGASGSVSWNFDAGGIAYRGLMLSGIPVLDSEEGVPGPPALLTVYYAAPTAAMEHATAVAGWAIAGSSLALLLLTSWYAAWRIGRELEPLRQLAQQAAAITPRNWNFVPTTAVAELQPLIRALQSMLERLQEAQRRQSAFLADTAHHLKTPVTVIKATQQMLLQRPRDADEYRAAALATLQDTERLHQLLQRMLRLAHLDAAEALPAAPAAPAASTEIRATLWSAMDRVQPLAEALAVTLQNRDLDLATMVVPIAAEDLEVVWVNLLENAIQHSPPRAVVEFFCTLSDGEGTIQVRDHGDGIPPEQQPHVFERFWRGPESRGFGLGLAIARATVEAAGGRIEVESSTSGTTMRVRWSTATA